MTRLNIIKFISYSSQIKESIVGTAKSVKKDAKSATAAASQALQDDFQAVGDAVANASDKIDEKVRDTGKERFHAAEEAAQRSEEEDRKFVMSEHAENPFNKAAKMAHDAKESAVNSAKRAASGAKESFSEPTESITEKVGKMAETVVGKGKKVILPRFNTPLVKETVGNVKESLTKNTSDLKINPAASINPMGDHPNREPLSKPDQKKMTKETEELQKKGADRKAEEDSFNLM